MRRTMAKNKNKNKIVAQNSVTPFEKQVNIQGELTAKNALEQSLMLSNWDSWNYNQSLSSINGYNNISLELLSLQQILLTYLYKTFGILAKVVDIPVDDAYKDGGFDLEADSIDEKELEAIMEREFGPIRRKQYSEANEQDKTKLSEEIIPLEERYEILIIDITSLEKEIRAFEQR